MGRVTQAVLLLTTLCLLTLTHTHALTHPTNKYKNKNKDHTDTLTHSPFKPKSSKGKVKSNLRNPKAYPHSLTHANHKRKNTNDCKAYQAYKKMKALEDKERVSERVSEGVSEGISEEGSERVSERGSEENDLFVCTSYDTCMSVHLDNLKRHGLTRRCTITDNITDVHKRYITFTHVSDCTTALLHYFTTALLHYCTLHYCTLHYCTSLTHPYTTVHMPPTYLPTHHYHHSLPPPLTHLLTHRPTLHHCI